MKVDLKTVTEGGAPDASLYNYTVSAGKLQGEGYRASWDLTGLPPGQYTAEITLKGQPKAGRKSVTVLVESCKCRPVALKPCPFNVNVSTASRVNEGDIVTFWADVDYAGERPLSYVWEIDPPAAPILTGQGTPTITVDTSGLGRNRLGAKLTVDDGSGERECRQAGRAETAVDSPTLPLSFRKLDEFRFSSFDNARARLDNLAEQMNADPGADAFVVVYGQCREKLVEAANFIARHLTGERRVDRTRLRVVGGGCREVTAVEMWVVPRGASPPTVAPAGPCAPCPPPGQAQATPSPGATPTPAAQQDASTDFGHELTETERVRIMFPRTIYVYLGKTETVRVRYEREAGRLLITTVDKDGVRTQDVPLSLPAGVADKPGPISEAFPGYEAFLEAELKGALLRFEPSSYAPVPIGEARERTWEWQVLPDGLAAWGDRKARLTIKVIYKHKQSGEPHPNPRLAEPLVDETLEMRVDVLPTIPLATLASFFVALGGAIFAAAWKLAGSIGALAAVVLTARPNVTINAESIGVVGDHATVGSINHGAGTPAQPELEREEREE